MCGHPDGLYWHRNDSNMDASDVVSGLSIVHPDSVVTSTLQIFILSVLNTQLTVLSLRMEPTTINRSDSAWCNAKVYSVYPNPLLFSACQFSVSFFIQEHTTHFFLLHPTPSLVYIWVGGLFLLALTWTPEAWLFILPIQSVRSPFHLLDHSLTKNSDKLSPSEI